jgi:hypothetical protein
MSRIIKDFNSFKVFENAVKLESIKDIVKDVKDLFKNIDVHVKGTKHKFHVNLESNDSKKGRTYEVSLALDVEINKEDVSKEVMNAEKKILKLLPKGTEFLSKKEDIIGDKNRIHFKFITPKED